MAGIDPTFQSLGIEVFPFMKGSALGSNMTTLIFNVTLFGTNSNSLTSPAWTLLWNRPAVEEFIECFEPGFSCLSFLLLDEPDLDYSRFRIEVSIPGGDVGGFIGDYLFQWQATNPAYIVEQVVIRSMLSCSSLVVAIWFGIRLGKTSFKSWTMEQFWGLVLSCLLVFLNNPLYPLQAFTASAFFPVLFSLFEAAFVSVWMLYALLYLEMVRAQEHGVNWDTILPWLKVAIVSVYFILFVALSMWREVLFFNDPIIAPESLMGPMVLFYIVALGYAGLVGYIVVLLIFIWPRIVVGFRGVMETVPGFQPGSSAPPNRTASGTVNRGQDEGREGGGEQADSSVPSAGEITDSDAPDWHEVTTRGGSSSIREPNEPVNGVAEPVTPLHIRYMHTVLPIIFVAASTLIGVVSGNIGPFGRSAPSFMYFFFMYNMVSYFWVAGYWPMGNGVRVSRSDERRPLVENPFATAGDHLTENEPHPIF